MKLFSIYFIQIYFCHSNLYSLHWLFSLFIIYIKEIQFSFQNNADDKCAFDGIIKFCLFVILNKLLHFELDESELHVIMREICIVLRNNNVSVIEMEERPFLSYNHRVEYEVN